MTNEKNCCHTSKGKCVRKSDGKVFNLPRKFTRKTCLSKPINGFTMKASCSPFKDCKKK